MTLTSDITFNILYMDTQKYVAALKTSPWGEEERKKERKNEPELQIEIGRVKERRGLLKHKKWLIYQIITTHKKEDQGFD